MGGEGGRSTPKRVWGWHRVVSLETVKTVEGGFEVSLDPRNELRGEWEGVIPWTNKFVRATRRRRIYAFAEG